MAPCLCSVDLEEEQQQCYDRGSRTNHQSRGTLSRPDLIRVKDRLIVRLREQAKHKGWACSDYNWVIQCVCVSELALCCLSVVRLSY